MLGERDRTRTRTRTRTLTHACTRACARVCAHTRACVSKRVQAQRVREPQPCAAERPRRAKASDKAKSGAAAGAGAGARNRTLALSAASNDSGRVALLNLDRDARTAEVLVHVEHALTGHVRADASAGAGANAAGGTARAVDPGGTDQGWFVKFVGGTDLRVCARRS